MNSVTYEDANRTATKVAVSVLVDRSNDPMAEALRRGLLAAGFAVTAVPTVFDAVVETARSGVAPRHIVVGVDLFGQQEFRLIPLARREWPTTTIVAYHSAGFEHKGRLAEMIGADVVLDTHEAVIRFVEGLAPSASNPAGAEEIKNDSPFPPRERVTEGQVRVAQDVPLTPALSPLETGGEGESLSAASPASVAPAAPPALATSGKPAAASARPGAEALAALADVVTKISPAGPYVAAATPKPQPPAPQSEDDAFTDGEVVGTVELTEEELRLLLGEEEGA
jgi:hypothetical protein